LDGWRRQQYAIWNEKQLKFHSSYKCQQGWAIRKDNM
jgi:hypothetical protein